MSKSEELQPSIDSVSFSVPENIPSPRVHILDAYSADPISFVRNIVKADIEGFSYTYERDIQTTTLQDETGELYERQSWNCYVLPLAVTATDPQLQDIDINRLNVSRSLNEMSAGRNIGVADAFNRLYDQLKQKESGTAPRVDPAITRRL
jgi:hypothetical protein